MDVLRTIYLNNKFMKLKKTFTKSGLLLSSAFLILFTSEYVNAQTLQNILQNSLTTAPEIKEAKADIESSHHRTKQAESQHWPILSLTGSKSIAQYHKDKSDYTDKSFIPGVEGQVNIYSFGAMEADVNRSKKEEEFYLYQYGSTQEDLAYKIAKYYLEALSMKEAIIVARKSLKRHEEILQDLDSILSNDEGRESEYVQANARLIMVEKEINNYRKRLSNALNSLSKYTKVYVTATELTNPFNNLTDKTLFSKYTLSDKSLNPNYQTQKAELDSKKLAVLAEDKKRLPKINLVASATKEDRQVGIKVSWDIFNAPSGYSVREKASQASASYERLERISRDIEERAKLAKINIEENRAQLKTLKAQMKESLKVTNFYKLQFEIARKTLLDVLNSERELSDVELAYVTTENDLRLAILDYLYSQGAISNWSGIKNTPSKQTN